MTTHQAGDKFRLLLYQRSIQRYRRLSFTLALLLLVLWYPVSRNDLSWPPSTSSGWLLFGGLVSLIYWFITIFGPRMAFAQAQKDHLRLQTPFYKLRISYQRIQNTRPVDIKKMFPPASLRKRDLWLLKPFFGTTALGVNLHDWPIRPGILRLFFNSLFLANDQTGLVLVIEGWMELSNQIQDRIGVSRASRRERRRGPAISAADILWEDDQT